MKLGFQSQLKAEDLRTGRRKLLEDFQFWDGAVLHIVPAGFNPDGTSVPWFLRWWVSPWQQPFSGCAVLHDWFYRKGHYKRVLGDKLFYFAIRIETKLYIQAITPVGTFKGWLMRHTRSVACYITAKLLYYGVRLFGWYSWNKHRTSSKSGGVC